MPTYPRELEPGAFIATTDVFDVQTIYEMDVSSQEFKEFLVRLRQNINNIAMLLNIKDTGYYPLTEFVCGQAYYPNPALSSTTAQNPTQRQVFRKVFSVGPLPNTALKSVAHGITFNILFPVKWTRIYGVATNPAGFTAIPLPYPGIANIVEVNVDTANINITTNFNATMYVDAFIVLEWIKE